MVVINTLLKYVKTQNARGDQENGFGADEDQSLFANFDILAVNEIAMAVVIMTSS